MLIRSYTPSPRRAIPKNFSLDADVVPLLPALSPNTKAFGRLLSELVRREYDRRAERLALLPAMMQEGVGE